MTKIKPGEEICPRCKMGKLKLIANTEGDNNISITVKCDNPECGYEIQKKKTVI